MLEVISFYFLSAIAVATAAMVILHRNPIYSAVFLAQTFFALAGLFLLLGAYFVAIIQILVYAGAILVLFLFVIMLLNLQTVSREFQKLPRMKVAGIIVTALLLIQLLVIVVRDIETAPPRQLPAARMLEISEHHVETLGEILFTTYLFPFEVASILLLVAMIGVIVLAKRKLG